MQQLYFNKKEIENSSNLMFRSYNQFRIIQPAYIMPAGIYFDSSSQNFCSDKKYCDCQIGDNIQLLAQNYNMKRDEPKHFELTSNCSSSKKEGFQPVKHVQNKNKNLSLKLVQYMENRIMSSPISKMVKTKVLFLSEEETNKDLARIKIKLPSCSVEEIKSTTVVLEKKLVSNSTQVQRNKY